MKKIVIGVLCLFSLTAKADVWECIASGDVEIRANNMIELVNGRIGATEVRLFQYGRTLEGRIEGLDTLINLKGNTATGTIGVNKIRWDFNQRTGLITGYQRCILSGIRQ